MRKNLSRANPPIAEVVVAFQPRSWGRSYYGMEPGRVALFRLGDTRSRLFDCEDGAVYMMWRDADPEQQLEWMLQLKKDLIRECGVSPTHVEGVFRQCPEFRRIRTKQRLRKEKRLRQERRKSVRTR